MKLVVWVDILSGSRRSLRQFPKRLPIFRLCVKGIHVKQLLDVITEQLEEFAGGHEYCVVEVGWSSLQHLHTVSKHLEVR